MMSKVPAKKESKLESIETKAVTAKKTEKLKPVEKETKKIVPPSKHELEAKPKSQIKNKSSTETKKGKT